MEEIERSLIGALMLDGAYVMGVCAKRRVSGEWFGSKECRVVWEAAEALWNEQGVVDGVLLADRLKRPEVLGFLAECMQVVPTALHAAQYVEKLAAALLKRRVVALGSQLMRDAEELGAQVALERAEGAMVDIRLAEQAAYGGFKTVGDFAERIVGDYEKLRVKRIEEGDKKFFLGLRLPWDVLNVKYTGVKAGIHIVAARPSQGKTAIMVCMSAGLAFGGVKQLVFSVDMAPRLLAERYGSFLGQVSLPKLNFGGGRADVEKMRKGLEILQLAGVKEGEKRKGGNVLISDASRIDRMLGEIHRAVKYDGVKCVWIDYLQILSGEREYRTKKEEVDAVLAKLKQAALGLDIPIFCLAQLNRENGKDPNREPQLTDLGDSGSIEREASTVLALWKDPDVRKAWDEEPPLHLAMGQETLAKKVEPIWLMLLKNQQGATGNAPFVFYKNYFMFRPADHDAKPLLERDAKNRVIKKDKRPYFDAVRDDFLVLSRKDGTGLDDWLEKEGCLGFRGLKNLNLEEKR